MNTYPALRDVKDYLLLEELGSNNLEVGVPGLLGTMGNGRQFFLIRMGRIAKLVYPSDGIAINHVVFMSLGPRYRYNNPASVFQHNEWFSLERAGGLKFISKYHAIRKSCLGIIIDNGGQLLCELEADAVQLKMDHPEIFA